MLFIFFVFITLNCLFTNGFVLKNIKKTNPLSIHRYSIEPKIIDDLLQSSEFLFTIASVQVFLYMVVVVEKVSKWMKS